MRKIMFGTHVLVDLDELADKYTKEEIDNMISTVFVYKGTVATTGDLNNIENPKVGDCWNVEADGNNYAWNGSEWDKLSGTIDLSDYYTKTQVDAIKSALELQIQAVKSLPTGGTEGQVLTKNSDTNGDASWKSFNGLVFKGHVDTSNDLPNLGQPSGTLIAKSYDYTNNFSILKTSCNIKNEIGALADKIASAKENETYYIGINGGTNSIYAIGTNYPEIITISHDNEIIVKASGDKTASAYYYNGSHNASSFIDNETYKVPVTISSSINWFETNISSIGIDTSTYNTFTVSKDDGSSYYYNSGMTLLGTSGGTSYVVTDSIPEDLKAYNFYTVGNNNDMYVFNGNTFDIFSKSKVPSGGTTGQVLSKNSDTDDDTSWKSLPNSLSIKEHIDSENELPVITQASGTQLSNNYQLSTTGLVNNLNKKTIDLPENLASSINTYKSQYKYYFIFYPSINGYVAIFTNNYNVLGLDSDGHIVGIDNDENSKVLNYSSEGSITEDTIIKDSATIDINSSTQSLYFETNIPNITAYSVPYDSFSYQIDVNGEAYYYNKGMPIISTLNGTSYLVTNKTPDIQFNYNEIYTVGDYYDLYVIDENSSNWVCYSKSHIPKGGTTGQVLSKNSDAEDDVIWKTLEASGGNSSDFKTYYMSSNSFYSYDDPQSNDYPLDDTDEQAIISILNEAKEDEVIPIIFLRQGASYSTLLLPNFDKNMLVNGTLSSYTFYSTLMVGLYQSRKNYLNLDSLIEVRVYTIDVKYNKESSQFTSASYTRGATRLFPVNNTTSYTPTSDYNLSTKKYVDDITGSLESLQTTDKTSLVAAINEIYDINVVTSLWTNSSPTSNLTPGNITLSSSTDDYDSIEFIFTDYIETNNYLSVTVPKGKNVNLSCNLYFANLMHYCSRVITYVNATTYDVKEGYNTSNSDPNSPVLHNDCCILQEIRGHKVIKSS